MKRSDIGLIAIVAIVSAVLSIVLSSVLFGGVKNREQQVEVVQPITSSFSQPDGRYFNKEAFDPTQQISTGQESNSNPFSSTTR